MKEPGLDGRHRDKDGTIQQKRSDTKNKNLSNPIPGFGPETTLKTMREKTGKVSEKGMVAPVGWLAWRPRTTPARLASGVRSLQYY